jgi:hypothetical protein
MARKATGQEVLEKAEECLVQAQTVEELRQAQSVLLPLTFGLSLKQTTQAIGASTGWACQLRRRFLKDGGVGNRSSRGGRRRENLTQEQEAEFLVPFLEKAQNGGMLIVTEIKIALEKRLERRVALASVYNLCTVMAGGSWLPTNGTESRTLWSRKTGKNLNDTLKGIDREWKREGPLLLLFQDEGRFGRISGTRRGWVASESGPADSGKHATPDPSSLFPGAQPGRASLG